MKKIFKAMGFSLLLILSIFVMGGLILGALSLIMAVINSFGCSETAKAAIGLGICIFVYATVVAYGWED